MSQNLLAISPEDFDLTHFEHLAELKLLEFESRVWGDVDQDQIDKFADYRSEIE